jgi:prepilin-type N-terminal cleavage/methylation domain-containing protein
MSCGTVRHRRHDSRAFTMIELMVVIAIIAMLALVAMPSVVAIYNSGSDAQAYNMAAALLTAARSEAIQQGKFTIVHFQLGVVQTIRGRDYLGHSGGAWYWRDSDGNVNRSKDGLMCAAIFVYDQPSAPGTWSPAVGRTVYRFPGSMAFGQVDEKFVAGGSINGTAADTGAINSAASGFDDFTTFNVIFSPTGAVVKQFNGKNVDLRNLSGIFAPDLGASSTDVSPTVLWALGPITMAGQPEPGVSALTMFDYNQFDKAANKATWLNGNGQLIAINVYTGQLFPRR